MIASVIAVVLVTMLWLAPSASAQESCPDTLAWIRALAVRIGQARAQAEIEAAQAMVRAQQLQTEVGALREALKQAEERLKAVPAPSKEKGS